MKLPPELPTSPGLPNLPDLYDTSAVNAWQKEQLAEGHSAEALMELLRAEGSDIAHFRAVLLNFHLLNYEKQVVNEQLGELYNTASRPVQLLAVLTRLHLRIAEPEEGWPPDAAECLAVRVAVEDLLKEIYSLGAGPLKWEAEWRAAYVLLEVGRALQDAELVDVSSSRVVSLAYLSNKPTAIALARLDRASSLVQVGKYSESVSLYLAHLGPLSPIYRHMRATTDLINALVNLGNFSRARAVLSDAEQVFGPNERLHAYDVWLTTMTARGALDEAAPLLRPGGYDHPYAWQIEALGGMTLADMRPPSARSVSEQRATLGRSLELSELHGPSETYRTDIIFNAWLRARALLRRGSYGLAAQELAQIPQPSTEDLTNRVLLGCLKLELAMSPADLPTGLLDAGEGLRNTFAQARVLEFSNSGDLSLMALRWHPHAAALLALMPHPIPEFQSARNNVAHVGARRVTWQDAALPAGMWPYLVRSAFGLSGEVPKLGGNSLAQLTRLKDRVHDLLIWGPVVTILPVVLGLLRLGHAAAAAAALEEFGAGLQVTEEHDLPLYHFTHHLLEAVAGRLPLQHLLRELRAVDD